MTLRRVIGVVATALFMWAFFWVAYPYVFTWSGSPHREMVALGVATALLAAGAWLFDRIYPERRNPIADAGKPDTK